MRTQPDAKWFQANFFAVCVRSSDGMTHSSKAYLPSNRSIIALTARICLASRPRYPAPV
jgi:hypothetical protein